MKAFHSLIIVKILINFFIFFSKLNNILSDECSRDAPIKNKENNCESKYCTEDEISKGDCIIENEIIKTQWLNNIINIEISFLRYVNFASYSNGDMILEFCTYPAKTQRIFLGFKKNGRSFFKNKTSEKDEYFYSLNAEQNITLNQKFESKNTIIKLSGKENKEKEYLLSLSFGNSYVEIYDFDNHTIIQKLLTDFSNLKCISSFQNVAISLLSRNYDFYYLFGFIGYTENFSDHKFIIQKHIFYSLDNFNTQETLNKSNIYKNINAIYKENTGFSCFQTKNQIITCFFLNDNQEYIIVAYDYNLNILKDDVVSREDIFFNQTFYKCIHLKGEIGVFSYYKKFSIFYPILFFKKLNEEKNFENYLQQIELNKIEIQYDPYILLNDLIKMNDNKLCFCTTDNVIKEKLFIILINLFSTTNYKVRYYSINLKNLYGYSIHMQLRGYNYNNFTAVAFSSHNDYIESCSNINYDKSCGTLLIFSYPNNTDNQLILDDNFKQIKNINNIGINLKDYVKIENNVFGYKFSGIEIKNIDNCQNLRLFTPLNDNIYINYTLRENEIIKLELEFIGMQYNAFKCHLEYNYKIIQPDLDEYDKYCIEKDENNINNNTITNEKEEFVGRLGYFDIILNDDLIFICNSQNCQLCFKNNSHICINYSSENIIKDGNIEIIKREIKQNKEQLNEILPDLIKTVVIGKNYLMEGEDYSIIIKPTNTSSIPNSSHVDFSSCEKILRNHNNISNSSIVTFFQLELTNKNSDSLINQVGYQAFDEERNPLDLSLCNDTNIKIFHLIKKNSSFNLSFVSSFKNINVDVFNIKDSFFNDICYSYSDSENDVILADRIINFYKNYTLCQEGCTYLEANLEMMTIICDCKVKQNITTNLTNSIFSQIPSLLKTSLLEIVKCYKLVFSWKNKLKNIGFFIFSFLIIFHIPLLFLYFRKGIKPIKEYLKKEMIENGYLDKSEETPNKNDIKNSSKKIHSKNQNDKNKKLKSPPKKEKTHNTNKKIRKISSDYKDENSSINRALPRDNKIIVINNILSKNEANTNHQTKKKRNSKKQEKRKNKTKSNSNLPTQDIFSKNIEKNEKNERDSIDLNLININLNDLNSSTSTKKASEHILNIYTFDEACKLDYRSIFKIFYIYLLTKQAPFYAFLYRSPLVLFPLRLCLLLFIISSDLALNSIFYFEDKISEKYYFAQSLFLFAFSNNITVILLSTFVGFILLTLFAKLSNSTNDIREIFKKEEEKIRNNKKYVVTKERKKEIQKEINAILKKYKIKVIIFIILELLLMIFFWYYVTVFCHVYSSTQKSWLWDSFLSMLSRLVIDLLFCLLFAKLYRIGVESKIHCVYKIALFFYSFG